MVGAADNAFAPVRRWARGQAPTTLLASLLVLALLLCHGAMGGFHQLAPQIEAQAAASGAAQGHAHGHADHASALPDASPAAGPDGERPAGHGEGHPAPYLPPPGFYLAGLLVVLLALVLGPALRGAPLPILASWAARRPPPAAFLPGRTPTVSSLQVFRL